MFDGSCSRYCSQFLYSGLGGPMIISSKTDMKPKIHPRHFYSLCILSNLNIVIQRVLPPLLESSKDLNFRLCIKYCTRAIITRFCFEIVLDYKPRILGQKTEEFPCFLVHKLSVILTTLYNINCSEKWSKKYTSCSLKWRAYGNSKNYNRARKDCKSPQFSFKTQLF